MVAKKKPGTSVRKWDEELAAAAEAAAGMEANTGGGQFFSLRNGILSWSDSPIPNNEMAVIILDTIFETVYYEGKYDSDNPTPPVAFAFGRDQAEMRWHETSDPEFAGELCSESEVCQWGSADVGKGKAARETRRLAMIPAGKIDRNGNFEMFDEDHFQSATIGFMRLPVTSVKGYANFVKQVAGALKRPPFAIITKVSVVPDPKDQFKVVFEAMEKVEDDSIMEMIMSRREEAESTIDFPYNMEQPEEPAPKKRTSRAAKKPASTAKRGTRRKY